jgi:hypothetical protein
VGCCWGTALYESQIALKEAAFTHSLKQRMWVCIVSQLGHVDGGSSGGGGGGGGDGGGGFSRSQMRIGRDHEWLI